MIFDDALRLLKPERGNLSEYFPFVRNPLRHHDVVRREPVGRDNEEMLADFIHIADLAPLYEVELGKIRLSDD